MKAVVYDKKVLVLREVEKPVPKDDEILVKIHSVSVNAADYRSMKMGIIPKGKIFSADIAGQVEEAGKSTKRFKTGDKVFGDIASCGFGGFAEYVAVPENAVALIEEGISFEKAASIPMASLTALQALRNKGNIQPGHKVLIYGAGGGVGTFAVQLAKYFGAQVTAVCSSNNADKIRNIGADQVIDYEKDDITKSSNRYDLVLAVNGSNPPRIYRNLLNPNGICVMIGGALPQIIKFMLFKAFLSIGSKKMCLLTAKANTNDLELIMKLVEAGKVEPIIDRCYPLHETADAVRYLSRGHARGKVVIDVVGK
ncbi:MAG: NAD(P)-dependent alcohol dehydrogenase [Bacillota bacterium]|nr:NAD(P)-dependent alcohol dehydrogenase [Bacillota bacterium]